jgi:hypothetical protein
VDAAHHEPCNHDVILSHLTLDSDMQIGIAAVECKDVLPGTFNSGDIGMAFDIIRCQKIRQAMDIAGVHNLLKQSASQQFVVRLKVLADNWRGRHQIAKAQAGSLLGLGLGGRVLPISGCQRHTEPDLS